VRDEDQLDYGMRADGRDWRLVAMNDTSGRRGLWLSYDRDLGTLAVCAGREGDDAFVRLSAGDVLDEEKLSAIADVLLTARYALSIQVEELGTEEERRRFAESLRRAWRRYAHEDEGSET
jgi:hypothetical protein